MDTSILRALRQAGEGGVSGAELAQRLGISRAAIWARIEELRRLGYEIVASPHLGYRLAAVPDALHADDLLALLNPVRVVGQDIRVLQQTTSTNDVMEQFAREGMPEGLVVFAESQTQGRGRLGRVWLSPSGAGLWFSVLLRPELRPQAATQLNVAAATALVRAIRRQTCLEPEIKWPNDVLIGGRKVAGILTELSAELDHIRHVILGIGIDVNLQEQDFPPELRATATSLMLEAGRRVARDELAAVVLEELDRDYERVKQRRFPELATEWEGLCSTLRRNVRINLGDRILAGQAESLDDDGALLLRTEHGTLERIMGGDVTVEK